MRFFRKRLKISVNTIGGVITPSSVLAPKIGPLGLSTKKIGEDIAKKTKKLWNNVKVTVYLLIHHKTMKIKIIPSASSLIRREILKNNQDSSSKKNITRKQLLKISKFLTPRTYSLNFNGTIKQVLGTCSSMKVYIDGIKAKSFLKKMKKKILDFNHVQ
uniref:Ribosomal protein L2 n=1 Tax=Lotharella vacuolata TaxID=74820 RepID=A0A0H5BL81_9EUKA|nr:ribosomal protein L2 [Lotharella vacuolata]